jgi:hypothetical protein
MEKPNDLMLSPSKLSGYSTFKPGIGCPIGGADNKFVFPINYMGVHDVVTQQFKAGQQPT